MISCDVAINYFAQIKKQKNKSVEETGDFICDFGCHKKRDIS